MYTWWRHDMDTFSALLITCEGNPSVTCGFSEKLTTRGLTSKMASEVDDFFTVGKNTVAKAVESLVVWDALTLMLDKCGHQRLIMRLDRDKYMNSPHFSLAFFSCIFKTQCSVHQSPSHLSVGESVVRNLRSHLGSETMNHESQGTQRCQARVVCHQTSAILV